MQLTIATFNLENLFTRYAFIDDSLVRDNPRVAITGITSTNYQGNPLSRSLTVLQRNNTARAILDCQPDILAVQEVENLWTLRLFNDQYLSGYFDRMVLIEGNDGRGIDVGLCVRKGYNATIKRDSVSNDDYVSTSSQGANWGIYFYACDDKKYCTSLQYSVAWNDAHLTADQINTWMDGKGYKSLDDIRGLALPNILTTKEVVRAPEGVHAIVDYTKCDRCGVCLRSCFYDAITLTKVGAVIDKAKCDGCGMCMEVCPKNAASMAYPRARAARA